jgi:NitT/TauT family transport system substrate-binding protein
MRVRCLRASVLLAIGVLLASGGAPGPAAPPAPPAAATPLASAPTAVPAPVRVRLASQKVATDVAIYLADERGYFRQEGIDLEFVIFANASEMIPALATGQIEASPIAANPAAWNAVARGVAAKIVLDKGTFRPGHSDQALVVRKAVYDTGRGQRLEDLRGLTLAITPPGKATTSACALSAALQRTTSLTLDDLTIQPLPFPDQVPALANGSIDAAMMAEPYMSHALRQGSGVKVMGLDEMYPNFTISALGFASAFYANRPAAKGFTRAYIRAIRDYLAAISGRAGEGARAPIDELIARFTGIDLATVRSMAPPGFSPNGLPNIDSMLYCYQLFREQGLVPQPVTEEAFAALWGTELVEEVLGEIGRVPES